jgi:hypothetical protein
MVPRIKFSQLKHLLINYDIDLDEQTTLDYAEKYWPLFTDADEKVFVDRDMFVQIYIRYSDICSDTQLRNYVVRLYKHWNNNPKNKNFEFLTEHDNDILKSIKQLPYPITLCPIIKVNKNGLMNLFSKARNARGIATYTLLQKLQKVSDDIEHCENIRQQLIESNIADEVPHIDIGPPAISATDDVLISIPSSESLNHTMQRPISFHKWLQTEDGEDHTKHYVPSPAFIQDSLTSNNFSNEAPLIIHKLRENLRVYTLMCENHEKRLTILENMIQARDTYNS